MQWMPGVRFWLHFNVTGPAPLIPSVDMAEILSRGDGFSVSIFASI
jgi:hypothetical protein